jgi:hypothetical protein
LFLPAMVNNLVIPKKHKNYDSTITNLIFWHY